MRWTALNAPVLLLSALALQGCGSGDLGPGAMAVVTSEAPATVSYPAAKYMPLAIGRWWKYHEVVYDQASALQPQAPLPQLLRAEAPLGYTTSLTTERVLSREMLEGVWWYKMRRRWMGSGQDRITSRRHNPEGPLWSMDPSALDRTGSGRRCRLALAGPSPRGTGGY